MSTEATACDWTAFVEFVAARPREELAALSLEEGVEQFRAYQQQASQLRTKVHAAVQQGDSGEARELDDQFFDEIDGELRRRGLSE